MPVPRHVAYQITGTAPAGEIWTNTIRYSDGSSGAFTGLDLAAAAQQVKDRWHSMLLATNWFPASYAVTGCSAYVYGDSGTLVEQAASDAVVELGSGGQRMPHSTAIVASLITGVPGRRTRGRIYLPLTGAEVATNNGLLPLVGQQLVADSVAAALEDLRVAGYDVGADGLDPVVVSTTGGLATPITTVRVGNVPDVQRRRRNGLAETYASAAV